MLLIACLTIFSGSAVSAQTLKTDLAVYPEPPLPAMGPKGSKIVDPTFGTTILRVTDATDGPFGRALYSTYPSVNVNSTRVMGLVLSGYTKPAFWDLNATTFTVSNKQLPSNAPNFGYATRWSGTDPDVTYGSGGDGKAIWKFNVATNTATLIKDFTSVLPAGDKIGQMQQDLADNIFSMNILNASSTPVGYILWRRSDNVILLNALNATMNETYVDKTGRYFYWNDTSCQNHVYDLITGSAVFLADTSRNGGASGTTGFCHVGVGTGTVFTDYGNIRSMSIRSLATINTVTTLMSGYFPFTTQTHHQSFNTTNEAYGLVSRFFNQPGDGLVHAALDNEILQVSTSGNAVRRIAHHRSKTGPTQGGGYNDTPFANISPDGQFVAFTSNWGGTAGNNRQDLYLVKIPAATTGSDTIPPSAPTSLIVH